MKRHQPRGLVILHEDRDIIVVNKVAGLLTIATDDEQTRTAYHLLTDYVRKGCNKSKERIFIVHRLDRDTSGVLVFARTEEAKRTLQTKWDKTEKHYLAVVHGILDKKEGVITSYLAENAAFRVYSTQNTAQGQLSHTAYRVRQETRNFSLVDITLLTGRKNQIRVHFAEQGHPIVGDRKYGQENDPHRGLALHARSLAINHPFSGKRMAFEADVPEHFERLIGPGVLSELNKKERPL
jgi:tRNA pseudouridine32 synthase/23S rRNA pseudouridine746 synthase/23S rRNA pseudouridine1911/1915/1917 synthase